MARHPDAKMFQQLSKFAQEKSDFGRAFKSLAEWKVQEGSVEAETEIDQIAEAYLEDADFYNLDWRGLFRRLQSLGAGQVILGRHGRKTRFAWKRSSCAYVMAGALNPADPPEIPALVALRRSFDQPEQAITEGTMTFGGISVTFGPTTTQSDVNGLLKAVSLFRSSKAPKA